MNGIRPLESYDYEEVLRINAESQPGVARLDRTELDRLVGLKNEHLVLYSSNSGLVGYLLAFPSDSPYDGEEFILFTKTSLGSFIYIDQVAVAAAERRMGAASQLYQATAAAAWRRGLQELNCEVNLNPPNPGSLAFHRNEGFLQTSVVETEDGRTVALMSKRLL